MNGNITLYLPVPYDSEADNFISKSIKDVSRTYPLSTFNTLGLWRDGTEEGVMQILSVEWPVQHIKSYFDRLEHMKELAQKLAYFTQQDLLLQTENENIKIEHK